MNKGCGCLLTWSFFMLLLAIPYSLFFYKGPAAPIVKVLEFIERSDIKKAQSSMCNQEEDLSDISREISLIEGIKQIETDSIEEKEATVTEKYEVKNFYDESRILYEGEREKEIGVTYKEVKLTIIGENGEIRVVGEIWPARGYRKKLEEEYKSTDNHKKSGDCIIIPLIYNTDS
ncbi:MAG: hypothetical protein ACTS2F_07225 [Thainema sp.]